MDMTQIARDMGNAALLIVALINSQRLLQVSQGLTALSNSIGNCSQQGRGTPQFNRITGKDALDARLQLGLLRNCCRFLTLKEQERLLRRTMRLVIAPLLPVKTAPLVAQLCP